VLNRAKKVGTRTDKKKAICNIYGRGVASTITNLHCPLTNVREMRNDDCVEIGKLEEHLAESLGDGGGPDSLPDLTDSGTMINSSLDQGPVEDEIDQWAYLKRGLIHPFGSFRQ
jgi:hypothetical protein